MADIQSKAQIDRQSSEHYLTGAFEPSFFLLGFVLIFFTLIDIYSNIPPLHNFSDL